MITKVEINIGDYVFYYKKPDPPLYDIMQSSYLGIVTQINFPQVKMLSIDKVEYVFKIDKSLPLSVMELDTIKTIFSQKIVKQLIALQNYINQEDIFA